MENSKAYNLFIEQLHATGTKKMDGYNIRTLDDIYEWEREQVEDIIWEKFMGRNDADLAIFMPKLVKYDGVYALRLKVDEFEVPSESSFSVAEVLYELTKEKIYFHILAKNYEDINDRLIKIKFVSRLSHLSKNKDVYDLLLDIYINDSEGVNQTTAINGILYADGHLNKADDMEEIISNIQLIRTFKKDSKDERKDIIKAYQENNHVIIL